MPLKLSYTPKGEKTKVPSTTGPPYYFCHAYTAELCDTVVEIRVRN